MLGGAGLLKDPFLVDALKKGFHRTRWAAAPFWPFLPGLAICKFLKPERSSSRDADTAITVESGEKPVQHSLSCHPSASW